MNEFSLKAKLFFGPQAVEHLSSLSCTNVLVVTDGFLQESGMVSKMTQYLPSGAHVSVYSNVRPDPSQELVDAGEITADEARVHPSRSIITRALGNDPDMYADHFTLEVATGDRIIICSDGLSSMVEDSEIEDIAVSCVDPQTAADNLVSAALAGGGHDNVTVVVVDVLDDGSSEARRTYRRRWMFGGLLAFDLCKIWQRA